MAITDENTLRSSHFRQLEGSLRALSIATSDQLTLFPEQAAKADELARDFDHWSSVVRANYEGELSRAQADALAAIHQKFATMSRDGAEFDPELWTESALSSSVHWDDVRRLAGVALETFGFGAP